MKILLATYEYPPDFGGISAYLGGLFGALPEGNVRVLKLPMPARPFAWLWQLPRLWLAARDADRVVVSHLLPLGTCARFLGKPYALIIHGLDVLNAAAHPRKRRLASAALKQAKLIVANSRATAEELTRFGIDPSTALVLSPCPDPDWERKGIARDAREKYDLVGRQLLLSVGRFVPRKGFDRLIRLLPKLRKTCGDVVLVLAGGGPEEKRLREEAVRSGIADCIRFVIAPDQETLAALYRTADLFALAVRPSKDDMEGFGLVFLEAALFGLPSVGTRVGGVPEAIQDGVTGLLADPESEDDLCEKIRGLLTDPEARNRLGRAARLRVHAEFQWAARASRFLERLV